MIQRKINIILFIVGLLFISMNNIYGQAAIDIPLTLTDNQGGTKQLRFGLDPAATNNIDPALGESDLPPFPPTGVFEARWTLNFAPISLNLSSYWDYRNAPAFPFTGPVTHRILWQYSEFATSMTFTYNLPVGAEMVITSNNSTPLWTTGTLTGSGTYVLSDPDNEYTAARVFVTYTNIAPIVLGPAIDLAPSSLAFGNVNVGSNATLPVTVSNTGTAPLTISGVVSSAAQYTFAPSVFPLVIPVGGNSILNVTFAPVAAGLVNGTLSFTHDAPGSPSVYNVSGTGYVPAPVFAISPVSPLDFGSVNVGGSANLNVTVSNTGDAP